MCINTHSSFKNQMLITKAQGIEYHCIDFLILAVLNHNTDFYSKKYIHTRRGKKPQ